MEEGRFIRLKAWKENCGEKAETEFVRVLHSTQIEKLVISVKIKLQIIPELLASHYLRSLIFSVLSVRLQEIVGQDA